ncbi:MAG: peptidoglycan bridge formation glycyltransferase FemA/FemB family protein [Candidatus Buchananbacteria bacterium]
MKTVICDNLWQEKWDEFLLQNSPNGGFLQSWAWGEFQNELGKKIYRIAVIDDSENIKILSQLITYNLPFGKKYFYVPRGPVAQDVASQEFKILIKEIKRIAFKKGAIFVRIDPPLLDGQETKNILKNLGLNFVGEVEPKSTLILNLKNNDNEILAGFKSKTRYNIKVAQKNNITIEEGKEYFEDFWNLMQKTAKRDKIKIHSKKHYQKMVDILSKEKILKLMVAKFEDKVIAANLNIIFGKWCVYLHGSSDYDFRDKMATYLLQWESILLAKSRWCDYYDFGGASETKWAGITRFKRGFVPEGEFTVHIGAFDIPINGFWYLMYKILKRKRFK